MVGERLAKGQQRAGKGSANSPAPSNFSDPKRPFRNAGLRLHGNPEIPKKQHHRYVNFLEKFARSSACFTVSQEPSRNYSDKLVQLSFLRDACSDSIAELLRVCFSFFKWGIARYVPKWGIAQMCVCETQ